MKAIRVPGGTAAANTLTAATATGAGTTVDFGPRPVKDVRYFIKATSISSGGTIRFECSPDGSTWYTYGSAVTISATGNTTAVHTASGVTVARYWRGYVATRTDGTYTVDLEATRELQ